VTYLRDQIGISEDSIVPITFKQVKKNYYAGDDEGERQFKKRDGRFGQQKQKGFGRGSKTEEDKPAPVEAPEPKE